MALRVLSGMLFINDGPKNGRATIGFSPFALGAHPRSVSLRKARVIGADGAFSGPPATIVAARQFKILDVSPDTDYRLRINDTVTTNAITISWAGSGPIFHEEIPFMIVGEVGDRFTIPEIPAPRRPVRPRPRPRGRAKRRPSRRPVARRRKQARRKKSRR